MISSLVSPVPPLLRSTACNFATIYTGTLICTCSNNPYDVIFPSTRIHFTRIPACYQLYPPPRKCYTNLAPMVRTDNQGLAYRRM